MNPYMNIVNQEVELSTTPTYESMMNINKEKYEDIENAFTRLKANENDHVATGMIQDALRSLTNKTFDVKVVIPTSKNEECSVMSIFPDQSTIESIVNALLAGEKDAIFSQIWAKTDHWVIEIDSRILSPNVGLNEKELTAFILHEVGHAIYSNSIPQRIGKVLKFELAKTNMVTKEVLKDNFFKKILYLPIVGACSINREKSSIKSEIKADAYAVKSGYREPLSSAMDKIIIYAGNKSNKDTEMKELAGFSIDSIIQLQNRQNKIAKRNLDILHFNVSSPFARKVLESVQLGLCGNVNDGWMTESRMDDYVSNKIQKITDDFYASEAFFTRTKRMKRIDPADIDYIGLELNAIKSNDDKMMIVSYIYNKLDTIDYYISLIDSRDPKYIIPHSRESLVQMRNLLDNYRKMAIDKKIPEINYQVNVTYPSGYEG